MTEYELYKRCLLNNVDITYGLLMLCSTRSKSFRNRRYKYQVHSDDFSIKFSQMYESLDEALNKFLELKKQIRFR